MSGNGSLLIPVMLFGLQHPDGEYQENRNQDTD
jgi:hypothetical protein